MEGGQRSAQHSRACIAILMVILFVSHGLLVWGHGDPFLSDGESETMTEEDEDFIDFTDMVNYDPVTRKMVNKKEKEPIQPQCTCDCDEFQKAIDSCRTDLEAHDKEKATFEAGMPPPTPPPGDAGSKEACSGEEMFFKRFARHIVDKLAEKEDENDRVDAKITVNLNPSSWIVLRDFVYNKKGRTAEAYDELTEMITYVDHVNVTTFTMWMEETLQMDRSVLVGIFYVVLLGILFVIFEKSTTVTWGQQLRALIIIFIFISIFWNWLFLYKKEVAKRMAAMTQEPPEHCLTGKMNLWDTFTGAMRSRFTFDQDPCKLYNEQVLVDPIYEVPPTKAITHTFATLFLEPFKHLGKAMADFNSELFANLPLQAWIPALLSVYGAMAVAVLVCMRCTWSYTREPRIVYQQVQVPAPVVQPAPAPMIQQQQQPAPAIQQQQQPQAPLPGLPARERETRIQEIVAQPPVSEPQARPAQQQAPKGQDVRRRPPRQTTSHTRRTSDRQDSKDSPSSSGSNLQKEPEASTCLDETLDINRASDSTDSEDFNVLQRKDKEKPRRRSRKRSTSPPKVSTKSTSNEEEEMVLEAAKTSESGSPMGHPELEFSSVEPSASLMQSLDSSTVLVASARHVPPPTSLGDMGEAAAQHEHEIGRSSESLTTTASSPYQCNTPSSISVLGDEASIGSSDDCSTDVKPALDTVRLSVSGELPPVEPEVLGAEGGMGSGREGSNEDDDFEVLHKEQLS